MTLQELNEKFVYIADGKLDSWNVMEEASDGFFYGDCEDYALTLKYKVYGFKDLELYFCKYDGGGHVVGKLYSAWIDNITQELISELDYTLYTDVRKMWMIEVWARMLWGKVIRLFKG